MAFQVDTGDIFGSILGFIDRIGSTAVETLYNSLATTLAPVFWASAVLWVAWWGYELVTAQIGITPKVFIGRVIKLLVIYTFAFNWATYNGWVVEAFNAIPNVLAGAVCQISQNAQCTAASAGIGASLDQIWDGVEKCASTMLNNAGWTGLGLMVMALLILVVGLAMVVIALALLVLAKMTLFLIVAMAPVFISFALFGFTSFMWNGWVSAVSAVGIVMPALIYGILGIMMGIMEDTVSQMQRATADGVTVTLTTIGPFLIMAALSIFLLIKVEPIAFAIVAGPRTDNYGGARGAASVAARMAAGGAGAAVRTIGNVAGRFGGGGGGGSLSRGGGAAGAASREAMARHDSAEMQGRVRASRS